MIKFIRKIIAILIIMIFAATSAFDAFADDVPTVTMTVSPPHQTIILIPGETYETSVDINSPLSESNTDLYYSVSIGPFSQVKTEDSKDDYGDSDLTTKSSYNQIMDWITLGKTSGVIEPGKKDTIPITITVPVDAPAGGQYATILINNNTDLQGINDGDNVVIQSIAQFGSIIYAEVSGTTRKVGSVVSNDVPAFLTAGPLETGSMVRNDGNVHTDASYALQVWPMFSDEEICTNEEKPATSLILPETERYHTETCDLPAVGIFRAKQTVSIFGETSIVERTIIICPVWLLFLIIFVIVAAIIWIVIRVRARGKSARREATSRG